MRPHGARMGWGGLKWPPLTPFGTIHLPLLLIDSLSFLLSVSSFFLLLSSLPHLATSILAFIWSFTDFFAGSLCLSFSFPNSRLNSNLGVVEEFSCFINSCGWMLWCGLWWFLRFLQSFVNFWKLHVQGRLLQNLFFAIRLFLSCLTPLKSPKLYFVETWFNLVSCGL